MKNKSKIIAISPREPYLMSAMPYLFLFNGQKNMIPLLLNESKNKCVHIPKKQDHFTPSFEMSNNKNEKSGVWKNPR